MRRPISTTTLRRVSPAPSPTRGKVTSYTYNAQGRLKTVTDPKGHLTTINYAANGLDATSVTDALNNVQNGTVYDAYHQPIQVTNALSQSSSATYTAWGALATTTDAAGKVTTYSYDATSKKLVSVSRNGATLSSYLYDAMGRVAQVTDAAGLSVSYAYNNLDKVTRVSYPDGTSETTDYVCCGLAGAVTDRAGRKSYYDYDAMKRLARVQDAAGNSVSVERDAEGRVLRLLDAKGNATRWTYDAVGRVTRKQYADGKTDEYAYAQGLLSQSRNPRGALTNYDYDDDGNVTLVDYASTPDVGLSYDALDRVTSVSDGLGTTAYTYDVLSRTTSVDGPFANDTVNYSYDSVGRSSGMNVGNSDGTSFNTTYGYDTLDRGNTLTSPVGTWSTAYVGNTGMAQSVTAPNGTKSEYSYDSLQRLTGVANQTATNAILSQYGYTIDNAKSIRSAMSEVQGTNPLRNLNYTYDAVDQLTGEAQSVSVNGGAANSTAFAYGQIGKLMQVLLGSNPLVRYVYDALYRMIQVAQKNASGTNTTLSVFTYNGLSRKRTSSEYSWIGAKPFNQSPTTPGLSSNRYKTLGR